MGVGLAVFAIPTAGVSSAASIHPAVAQPAGTCIGPPQNGSQTVLFIANGTSIPVPVSVLVGIPICVTESVTLVGAWVATEPTATVVLIPNATQFGWPCLGCYSTSGTYNTTLFPGSYDLYFDSYANATVTVVQPFYLIFDRTTVILQPTGLVKVSPWASLSWPFALPNASTRILLYSYEYINANASFYAGVMTTTQWAAFEANPSSFSWSTLAWWVGANGGGNGPSLATAQYVNLPPGDYFFVFYDCSSVPTTIHFTTPLELAYTMGSSASPAYAVSFAEVGLTTGMEWYVNVTGGPSLTGTGATLSTVLHNGSYTYTVASANKEYAASGGSFSVTGATVSQPVTFSLVTYAVTFMENGLPSGTEWWVNGTVLGSYNSTTATMVVNEPNGSYAYTVASANKEYAAVGGSVTVNGAAAPKSMTFNLVTYAVTFTETGLPSGTEWWVNGTVLGSQSSTTATIMVNEPNGTYTYMVGSADPSWAAPGGPFTVVGGPVSKPVTFGWAISVTFVESGLLPGAEWFVNISGEPSQNSTTTTITTGLSNGSYLYTFGSPDSDYSLAGGELLVDGAPVLEPLTFGLPTFTVTVTESGLPSGTAWSATLFVSVFNTTYHFWQAGPGLRKSSTTSEIVFVEPNGRYMCTAGGARGYRAYIQGYLGYSLVVSGTNLVVTATFVPYSYPVTFTETGLPAGKLWGAFVDGYGVATVTVGPRSSVTVGAPNGTDYYALVGASGYRVSGLAATGNLTVNGAAVTESFIFVKGTTYSITFTERGLPKGTSWCTTLVDSKGCLTTGSGTLSGLSPGTYPYTILPLPGQTITAGLGRAAIPLSGWLTLSAASLTVVVTYVYPYSVTFSETGLPNATNWCVTVSSSRECSTTGAVVFRLGNGSYVYRLGPVAGYLYAGSPLTKAKVAGGPTTVTVKFVHRHRAPILYDPSAQPVAARLSPVGRLG